MLNPRPEMLVSTLRIQARFCTFLQAPILAEILAAPLPSDQRSKLLAIYIPFLIIPLMLLARVLFKSSENLHSRPEKNAKAD